MTQLRFRSEPTPDLEHRLLDVTPERAGWKYVGFEVVRLKMGEPLARDTGHREACLVWLSGTSAVLAGTQRWEKVGKRKSVFDGPPHAVYVPPRTPIRVTGGRGGAEIAIGWAPAESGPAAQHFATAGVEERGEALVERAVGRIHALQREAARVLHPEVIDLLEERLVRRIVGVVLVRRIA